MVDTKNVKVMLLTFKQFTVKLSRRCIYVHETKQFSTRTMLFLKSNEGYCFCSCNEAEVSLKWPSLMGLVEKAGLELHLKD